MEVQFKHEERTLTASMSLPENTLEVLQPEVIEAAETQNKSRALEYLYDKYKDEPALLMLSCFMLGDMIAQSRNPLAGLMAKLGG